MTKLLLPGVFTATLLLSFGMLWETAFFAFAYCSLLGLLDFFGGGKK
jgi:hypothetical protein